MNPMLAPLIVEKDTKRIVVINTAFLGDLILTVPFLHLLKIKFPNSYISLVCKKGIGDFFIKLKLVDEILEVQKGIASDYNIAIENLNLSKQDFVFCIHRSFRSFLFSLKIKSKTRVGYNLFYNLIGYQRKISRNLTLPEPLRILQLLTLIDESFKKFFLEETNKVDFNFKDVNQRLVALPSWAMFPNISVHPSLFPVRPKVLSALTSLTNDYKRIAIFPGSVWNTKRWSLDSFADLAERLLQMNCIVILMGGPGEEIYGDYIEKRVAQTSGLINLTGRSSVWESSLVLTQCNLVITNDSASAHLAALLNKPILAFFGPTVLSFGYRPWGQSVYILENTKLACRPCGAHGHNKCPIKTHACMTSISVDSAYKKALSILQLTSS